MVGGAGSLYVNPEHTAQVMDGADFPEMFRPLATHMGKALDELRARGESVINYADYAVAMVDEALEGNHIQQRISVVGE